MRGAEVLEESEMEPFVMAVEGFASGKTMRWQNVCLIS
jgi:hypothetical protein